MKAFCALFLAGAMLGTGADPLPQPEGEIVLADAGKARAVIVTDVPVSAVQRLAARELKEHIRLMTGVELPIIPLSEWTAGDAVPIFLSRTAAEAEGVVLDGVGAEGFRLRVDPAGQKIFVIGRDHGDPLMEGFPGNRAHEYGTLYGVSELLEQLGVRWFYPGDQGRIVPKKDRVALAGQDTVDAPRFRMRNFWIQPTRPPGWPARESLSEERRSELDLYEEELRLWALRNRAGNSLVYHARHHSPPWWDLWHATRPELLALTNGRRGLADHPDRSKLCVSNPGTAEAVAELAMAKFGRSEQTSYSIGEQDGSPGFCECDGCKALDSGAISSWRGYPSLSDRYAWFWNQVGAKVRERFPERFVGTYVYSRYADPPLKIKALDPAVQLVIVNNYLKSKDRYRELVEGWGVLSPNAPALYVAAFPGANGMNRLSYPWISLREFQEGMRYLAARKVPGYRALSFELGENWMAALPMHYLLARLSWNPELPVETLIAEACGNLFGPAAPAVEKYLALLEEWGREPLQQEQRDDGDTMNHARADVDATPLTNARLEELEKVLESGLMADLTADQEERLRQILLAVRCTRSDIETREAYAAWKNGAAEGAFRELAAKRSALLATVPPFQGILDPRSLDLRRVDRGYEAAESPDGAARRWDFSQGALQGWRRRKAFKELGSHPSFPHRPGVIGIKMQDGMLMDRDIQLQAGQKYRLKISWGGSAPDTGLRARLAQPEGGQLSKSWKDSDGEGIQEAVWEFQAPVSDGRLYLYVTGTEGAEILIQNIELEPL